MNERKKLVLVAYKRLGILFVANMIILHGMSMEFLSALAGNIVVLLMMLLLMAFFLLFIPAVVSMIGVIISFVSGLKKLEQGDLEAAVKKGKLCARFCMVPMVFIILGFFGLGYFRKAQVVMIVSVCVALIIYDVYVIFLFKKTARRLTIAEPEAQMDKDDVEIGGYETGTYENDAYETKKQKIGSRENVYRDIKKTSVETGLDQRAYKCLGIIVWGSIVLIAVVVIVGWFYDMYRASRVSLSGTMAYFLAVLLVVGMFVGGVVACMIVLYRKGLKCLKDGDFHGARLRGVCNCVMSFYVYIFMFLAGEVILELQGGTLQCVRCFDLLILLYQIYVTFLFVKLRRSEKRSLPKSI